MEDKERKSRFSKRRWMFAFAILSAVVSITIGFILACFGSIGFVLVGLMLMLGGVSTISIATEWLVIVKDKRLKVILE